MIRITALATALVALGCSSYQLGRCREPVASSLTTRQVAAGVHTEVVEEPAALRVRTVHLCNVAEHVEQEAGIVAERLVPSMTQELLRNEKERDVSRMGPITTGMMRGEDDAGIQHRSLPTEVVRGISSPWLLAAGAGGIAETFLSARSRVSAKLDGERHERSASRRGVPCPEYPYEGVAVTIAFDESNLTIGRTDAQGELRFDLRAIAESTSEAVADVLVEGVVVAAVDLRAARAR